MLILKKIISIQQKACKITQPAKLIFFLTRFLSYFSEDSIVSEYLSEFLTKNNTVHSGRSRGGSGGWLRPPPYPLFLNIQWKWNNLVSVRPKYFIFMRYLRKMRENQQSKPQNLYTYEPPFQKSWIPHWYNFHSCKLCKGLFRRHDFVRHDFVMYDFSVYTALQCHVWFLSTVKKTGWAPWAISPCSTFVALL